MSLPRDVHGHARRIDDEPDGRRGRDERPPIEIEPRSAADRIPPWLPTTCGIETAATASFVSMAVANAGVSRLPIPKPATAATAPPAVPAMNSTR
ncbi:MAG TPA: hypothetical protein VFK20_08770 [Vicinamibacterales bacterium]|nr:hypothetical protein [Vicinamibacterales bacterium]